MKKKEQLPEIIPVFPLSNFIIFPETTVPLNIFEPRYIQMIDDTMKNSRMIGMIQPKKNLKQENSDLYQIGCLGKITSFNETDDGRYLVVINGLSRFKILDEIENSKLYRECKVSFEEFKDDFVLNKYVEGGVDELDINRLSDLVILKYNSLHDGQKKLGNPEKIKSTFIDFQKHLY